MARKLVLIVALVAGLFFTLGAIGGTHVTLANGDYRGVLREALVYAVLGTIAYAVVIWRGSRPWKIAGVIAALPLYLAYTELIRRSPEIFKLLFLSVPLIAFAAMPQLLVPNQTSPTRQGYFEFSIARSWKAAAVVVAFLLMSLVLVYSPLNSKKPDWPELVSHILLLAACIAIAVEVFSRRVTLSDIGLESHSTWARSVFIPWSELKAVKVYWPGFGFKLVGANGAIDVDVSFSGKQTLRDELTARVPHLDGLDRLNRRRR